MAGANVTILEAPATPALPAIWRRINHSFPGGVGFRDVASGFSRTDIVRPKVGRRPR
jgi:hypothetical protein